jgi:ElaB/YqjD/DUF883 family membrane-anchored ribosome-binding protein
MTAVAEELSGLKESLTDGVSQARQSGTRVIKAAGDAAVQAAGSVRDMASDYREKIVDSVNERPFRALAIAAGVGAVLALYLFRRK